MTPNPQSPNQIQAALWDPKNGPIGPYNGPMGSTRLYETLWGGEGGHVTLQDPKNGPMGPPKRPYRTLQWPCGTLQWSYGVWGEQHGSMGPQNDPMGPQNDPMGPQKWPYRTPKMAPWDVGGSTWLYETLK